MPFEFPRLSATADVLSTPAIVPASHQNLIDPLTAIEGSGRVGRSLLFIDSSVADYQQFVAAATPGTEVHVLSSVQDAVTQITNTLLGQQGIGSLHIVSHGEAGGLDFGSSRLNLGDLPDYAAEVQSWGKALTTGADILLYGCDVAATPLGVDFVQQLSQLTGADVAASIDPTGNVQQGGNWNLEVATGKIESASAFLPGALTTYEGTLGSTKGSSAATQTSAVPATSQPTPTAALPFFSWESQQKAERAGYNTVTSGSSSSSALLPHPPRVNFPHVQPIAVPPQPEPPTPQPPTPQPPTPQPPAPVNPGSLALGQTQYTVSEGAGSVAISVVRSGGSDGVATIAYTTVDATAIAGQDYTTASGILTFGDGETSKTVIVPILNDTIPENTETFNFALGATTGAALGVSRTGVVTILDDDAAPTIEFAQSNFNVNENDGTATVTLRRLGSTSIASSVQVATSDGTATAGSDYTAASGTVTFGIGETVKTFTVPILDDTIGEPNETFNLSLSNPVGAGLATQTNSTVTVIDNDPGNFVKETFVGGLDQPVSFAWSPDSSRMYIAEKPGVVRVAVNGVLQTTPFIDLSSEVNSASDRGMQGIAVNPDFANNPYIYLSFTYDPPEVYSNTGLAGPDGSGNRPSRLVRVTADPTTNYTTAIPGSEVVLLGKNSTWANISSPDKDSTNDTTIAPSGILNYGTPQQANVQDYLATDNQVHTIGFLKFAPDGSLFVGNGDGASAGLTDPRAARTLDIDNLSGKILRINPITGEGLADNPFYDGDPNSNRSKVYDYGLRNPYRFTLNPTTGEIVIGDVGWNTWEEINTGRGKNFGWPYYEGTVGQSLQTDGYKDLPAAQNYYTSPAGQQVTSPIFSRNHSDGAHAIIMGDYYTGNTFPSIYNGALFVTDVEEGNIDALYFDQNGQLLSTRRFDSGVPYTVQITMGKDSNLYYANVATGEVGRWRAV